jgi:hypothetical protein
MTAEGDFWERFERRIDLVNARNNGCCNQLVRRAERAVIDRDLDYLHEQIDLALARSPNETWDARLIAWREEIWEFERKVNKNGRTEIAGDR